MSLRAIIAVGLLLLVRAAGADGSVHATNPTHAEFDALLRAHVRWDHRGVASTVDYAGMRRDRARLRHYLATLAQVSPAQAAGWKTPERQAFFLNAYNAATIDLVLSGGSGLGSIKDLGGLFSSPWRKPVLVLLGKSRSLDEIEHGLLRGGADYRDPRIHFALNCASVGCPALRPEAYVGSQLEVQLEDQARRFLRDRQRNRFDPRTGVLHVSKLFSWYRQDFDRLGGGVGNFLGRHAAELELPDDAAAALKRDALPLIYDPYDWSLNGVSP